MALAIGEGKEKSHKKKVVNYDTPRQVQQSQRWEQKESYQDKPPFRSRHPSHSQGARSLGGRGNSRGNGFQRGNKRGGIRLNLVTLSKHLPIAGRLKYFVKNWEIITSDKKILKDTQNVEINSVEMMFYLTSEKVSQIKTKYREMLSAEIVTERQLAQLTGKLSSSMQAIFQANLQSRFLQIDQINGLLKEKSYEQEIILSQTARDELIWWVT
ncbi:unnamed protein product [Mytilus coruscus]|uniref:Uncharacterized protein n=1 Tax=Mytilus coruscus TaxID=42192 RepID=A0A6J8A489_MYTCO|nr:unnamed protein product [Mytilus coruscus]